MSAIRVAEAFAMLTADGGAGGYVTVASNVSFYPGATVWLCSDVANHEAIITDLSGSTLIGIRFKDAKAAKSDCSAYLTGDNASINMPTQAVPVNPSFSKIDSV